MVTGTLAWLEYTIGSEFYELSEIVKTQMGVRIYS